jgi:hypothetical protein
MARRPSPLEGLPPELLVSVIRLLDTCSLAHFAFTCRFLYADRPRPMTPVEEALRQRAAERARFIPRCCPAGFNGWVPFLLHHDSLADGRTSVAAGCTHSFFLDPDGHLLQCGEDPGGDSTPRSFSSLRDVHFQSVSCSSFLSHSLALSEEGEVYWWGIYGNRDQDVDSEWGISYVVDAPEIVPGSHSVSVRQIAAGKPHCAALTEEGGLYTWAFGECAPYPQRLSCSGL